MKNKKITILADFDTSGGTRTYFKWLVDYLSQNNFVTAVLLPQQIDSDMDKYLKKYSKCTIIILPKKFERGIIFKILRRLKMQSLFDIINDKKITHYCIKNIHTDYFFISQGGGFHYFSFLLQITQTFLIMHSLVNGTLFNDFFARQLQKKIISYGLQNHKIISVSQFAHNSFLQNCQIPFIEKKSISIYNHGGSVQEKIEKKKHESITVLTLGHLTGYKNPDLWLQIAKSLTESLETTVIFLWAGEGNALKTLQNETSHYTNIQFLGHQTNTKKLYETADIYFQPSSLESFGICVSEALKYSLPCVVSNIGGLPEQIVNSYNGFVCELDFEKMKQALFILIQNKELREQMSKNARIQFEKKFTKEQWQKNMDRLTSTV